MALIFIINIYINSYFVYFINLPQYYMLLLIIVNTTTTHVNIMALFTLHFIRLFYKYSKCLNNAFYLKMYFVCFI